MLLGDWGVWLDDTKSDHVKQHFSVSTAVAILHYTAVTAGHRETHGLTSNRWCSTADKRILCALIIPLSLQLEDAIAVAVVKLLARQKCCHCRL